MKCPKCGYNSFEFHDACKKCSHDLTGYKNTYGLKAIVIPQAARSVLAASMAASVVGDQHAVEADETTEMFSFDLSDEGTESGEAMAAPNDDPFNFGNDDTGESNFGDFSFDDEPEPEKPTAADQKEDGFASLLESTPQDPFALQDAAPAAPPKETSTPGEFDLDSFSWDEPEPGAPKPEDDFNDLFGNNDSDKDKK